MKNNTKKILHAGKKNNHGFVLVTGLILLLAISIVAISTMQNTIIDYKISSNSAITSVTFQVSESARTAAGTAIKEYTYDRSWTGITTHSGLSKATDYNPLADNATAENHFDPTSLVKDMDFFIAKNGNVDAIDADLYIIRSPTATGASGSGIQQLAGYRGTGKGAASSGSHLYFELRSKGFGGGSAETTTASEYRVYVQ